MQERYWHSRGESWMCSHSFWGQQLQWRPGPLTFLLQSIYLYLSNFTSSQDNQQTSFCIGTPYIYQLLLDKNKPQFGLMQISHWNLVWRYVLMNVRIALLSMFDFRSPSGQTVGIGENSAWYDIHCIVSIGVYNSFSEFLDKIKIHTFKFLNSEHLNSFQMGGAGRDPWLWAHARTNWVGQMCLQITLSKASTLKYTCYQYCRQLKTKYFES